MTVRPALPIREVLRGRRLSWVDLVVGAGIIALLYAVVRLGQSMAVNFTPGRTPVIISTDIANVPYYAARSLLRMFIALALSTVFTLVYGTAAARLRRAEKVLVPILDILQSIPILVFLPIALTFFIKVFPNNLLGLELASIFVIFTSQAWNMTFSFYHSLISQPTELDEAARMYRLTKWQRFWKLDVPSSMIGLVWNMMMSMGGGWFFLTASEAVTVFVKGKGISESLPGMGSYMAAAVAHGSYTAGDHRHRGDGDPGGRDELLRLPAPGGLVRQVPPGELRSGRQAQERGPRPPAPLVRPPVGRPRQPPGRAGPRPDHPALRAGRVPAAHRSSASARSATSSSGR